ncbi:MAG: ribonuclease P protein component [Mycoplasmataceae bacterium]|jgi:ribonuclease P protein component|nr:ribonuclease P protein component [Mycoplasmataceae bacterium]
MKNKDITVLKKSADFTKVVEKHSVFNNVIFKIKAAPNNLKKLRYGLAVNKKNFPTAVVRNLIKRQMRQFIQQITDIKYVDMIIVVKSNYINNKYDTNKKFFNEVYNLVHFK